MTRLTAFVIICFSVFSFIPAAFLIVDFLLNGEDSVGAELMIKMLK